MSRANTFKPKIVPKAWGEERWVANNDRYCGKLLILRHTHACSLHFHVDKHETFHIVSGRVLMELIHKDGEKELLIMSPGDCIEITPGLMHKFVGLSVDDAIIMEVSTTHDDEDSYRISRGH